MSNKPWRVEGPTAASPHLIYIVGPSGNWTIRCTEAKSGARRGESPVWYGWKDEMKDARLIAAAPELVEALRNMLDHCNSEIPDLRADSVRKARAILAKIDQQL